MSCCQFKGCNNSVPASGDCRSMTSDTIRALGHTTNIKCIAWIWLILLLHVPVLRFPNCCWWCLGSWWLEEWRLEGTSCVLCVVLSRVVVCCIMLCCVEEWRLEGTTILALLGFQQKRGWEAFGVWWRVFLLTWWCSKYSPQHPFSLLNLLFAEKYKQGFQTLDAFLCWWQ